jgi:hypothetical protein
MQNFNRTHFPRLIIMPLEVAVLSSNKSFLHPDLPERLHDKEERSIVSETRLASMKGEKNTSSSFNIISTTTSPTITTSAAAKKPSLTATVVTEVVGDEAEDSFLHSTDNDGLPCADVDSSSRPDSSSELFFDAACVRLRFQLV